MRHAEAIAMFAGADLDRPAPSTWADLGCGSGIFTLALAGLLAPGSTIHAIDRDAAALPGIPREADRVRIETHAGDFTQTWPFTDRLDGILMANSLHYVEGKSSFLSVCAARLNAAGRFLVVEYDTDSGNRWVPYPVSAATLSSTFAAVGFDRCQLLGTRRSTYQRARLYAALVGRADRVHMET
jgi:SAM-dependent methyltransferase